MKIEAIVLAESRAKRNFSVEFEPPGRADIEFTFEEPVQEDDSRFVLTRCSVKLLTETREDVAEVLTSFLVVFADVPIDELESAEDMKRAAVLAAHPYHRQAIIELTEKFDIPTFRLDFELNASQYGFSEAGLEAPSRR